MNYFKCVIELILQWGNSIVNSLEKLKHLNIFSHKQLITRWLPVFVTGIETNYLDSCGVELGSDEIEFEQKIWQNFVQAKTNYQYIGKKLA